MIQALTDKNLINLKCKLSVDSINTLLLRNFTLTQIAEAHKVTQSAVSHYIKSHADEIIYDSKHRDNRLLAKTDRIVNKGLDHLNNIFAHDTFNKKDIQSISMTTGVFFDKMRILQDRSTSNVSIASIDSNIQNRQQRRQELLLELELEEASNAD